MEGKITLFNIPVVADIPFVINKMKICSSHISKVLNKMFVTV